jgi:hypothetical protein
MAIEKQTVAATGDAISGASVKQTIRTSVNTPAFGITRTAVQMKAPRRS